MQLYPLDFVFFRLSFLFVNMRGHPQAPRLQPLQYDKPPHYIYGGTNLSITCQGPIGDQLGQLIWELVYNKSIAMWSVLDDQKKLTIVHQPQRFQGVQFGRAERVKSNASSGYSIKSTLRVLVSSDINNSRLSCLTVSQFSTNSSELVNGLKVLRSKTNVHFNVLFIPRLPKLFARVVEIGHGRHLYYFENICEASCAAYVGTGGVLIMTFLNDKNILRWTFDLKRNKIYDKEAADVTRTFYGSIDFNPLQGPMIVTRLDIDVSSVPKEAFLSCYSYDVPNSNVLNNSDDPLKTSYIIKTHSKYDIFVVELEKTLLYLGVLWVVVCFAIVCMALRAKDEVLEEADIASTSSQRENWPVGDEVTKLTRRGSVFSFRTVLSYFRRTSSQASSVGSQADDRSIHSRRRLHFAHRLS